MNATITKPIANIYTAPNADSELKDEALHGWPVQIISEQNNFYYIKTFYDYNGYIKKEDTTTEQFTPTHTIDKNFADISIGEAVEYRTITTLPFGSYVRVLNEKEKYSKVQLSDATEGYTRSIFLKPLTKPTKTLPQNYNEKELRKAIINKSLTYKSTQYRWGGKTHSAIDCSGLTFMCYLANDIIIYRDAIMKDGFPVKLIKNSSTLKQADLIYWKGHIGIYLGADTFIHSSDNNGGVAIENLTKRINSHWQFVGYGSVF